MRTETTQHITADEKTVLRAAQINQLVCDGCGEVIYNDGHPIDGVVGGFTVCDGCYDDLVKTTKEWEKM